MRNGIAKKLRFYRKHIKALKAGFSPIGNNRHLVNRIASAQKEIHDLKILALSNPKGGF